MLKVEEGDGFEPSNVGIKTRCLRPDLAIPLEFSHLAAGDRSPATYYYHDPGVKGCRRGPLGLALHGKTHV